MKNLTWRFDAQARGLNPISTEPYLADFLAELAASGYARLSIDGYALSIAHFGDWLRRSCMSVESVDEKVIARFAVHRCRCFGIRTKKRLSARYLKRVRRFMCHLDALGLVKWTAVAERQESPIPYLIEFRHWIHRHRGLASQTIDRYEYQLNLLMPTLGPDTRRYDAARIRRVICTEARHHWASTAKSLANSLRAYLRFLASQGHCAPALDHAVPTVPQWRLSALPRYLRPDEVERVIESCDSRSAVGIRDRAVLLLLSRLGLRAGDIRSLRLDDINWDEGTLRVSGKGRRQIRLPLPQDAGDALLTYLTRTRPRVDFDQVFLCTNAPIRPLQPPASVSNIVGLALRRAGITNPPSKGANVLRHSAATSMLRAGATLDAVGSVLRHRSADTTAHYAKVDVGMLRQVVQQWPEDVSC
jgi:integrase/recombinase XerD